MTEGDIFKLFGRKVKPETLLMLASTNDVGFHFGQSAEDAILLRLFKGKTDGFYVDVGAFNPIRYSNTYVLHEFFGWSGINIDASSYTIKLFNKMRPKDINLNIGVGKNKGKKTFYKLNKSARSTFSKEQLERQTKKPDVTIESSVQIDLEPLSRILDKHLQDNVQIDVLNIDVEGFDLEVLKSNDWVKFRPSVILVEDFSTISGDKGLEKSTIYKYMKSVGYNIVSHVYGTSIYREKDFDITPQPKNKDAIKQAYKHAELQLSKNAYVQSRASTAIQSFIAKVGSPVKSRVLDENLILTEQIKSLEEKNKLLNRQKSLCENQLNQIKRSKSWRLTKILRKMNKLVNNR